MKTHFTILITPDQAYGQSTPQLAAPSFVPNAAVESRANDVQFCFAYRAFETENQSVVEQRRMV